MHSAVTAASHRNLQIYDKFPNTIQANRIKIKKIK